MDALVSSQAEGRDELSSCGAGLSGVTVAHNGTVTLDIPQLVVARGEILALIGPSGSGKTTALRAVAGFVRPRTGRVFAAGHDVTDLPPRKRGIGMVVQSYALFPHMTVADNVAFGLSVRGISRDEQRRRVTECLDLVGMGGFERRLPRALSGGQQQRVAIARALAIRPPLLLLDEPLSALDAQIRAQMVEEIGRLHANLPDTTILYVTHDQAEAMTLASRIAVLKGGKIAGLGTARALYERPPSRFVAEFLGRANLIAVSYRGHEAARQRLLLGCGDLEFQLDAPDLRSLPHRMMLCLRPHHLVPEWTLENGRDNRIEGILRSVHWLGAQQALGVEFAGQLLAATAPASAMLPPPGSKIALGFTAADATLLTEDV